MAPTEPLQRVTHGRTMKQISLPLVLGLLASSGCRTMPERDVRYEPSTDARRARHAGAG